ncbi:MAG: hypothetical protein Q8P67_22160 [archaeon]|nr:hypothetical protein [archaeon]
MGNPPRNHHGHSLSPENPSPPPQSPHLQTARQMGLISPRPPRGHCLEIYFPRPAFQNEYTRAPPLPPTRRSQLAWGSSNGRAHAMLRRRKPSRKPPANRRECCEISIPFFIARARLFF